MDLGLYYFNARWYSADTGRFITEDPIKSGSNWYVYARNNPLIFLDPSGLEEFLSLITTGKTSDGKSFSFAADARSKENLKVMKNVDQNMKELNWEVKNYTAIVEKKETGFWFWKKTTYSVKSAWEIEDNTGDSSTAGKRKVAGKVTGSDKRLLGRSADISVNSEDMVDNKTSASLDETLNSAVNNQLQDTAVEMTRLAGPKVFKALSKVNTLQTMFNAAQSFDKWNKSLKNFKSGMSPLQYLLMQKGGAGRILSGVAMNRFLETGNTNDLDGKGSLAFALEGAKFEANRLSDVMAETLLKPTRNFLISVGEALY